jgi:hypothetical protein
MWKSSILALASLVVIAGAGPAAADEWVEAYGNTCLDACWATEEGYPREQGRLQGPVGTIPFYSCRGNVPEGVYLGVTFPIGTQCLVQLGSNRYRITNDYACKCRWFGN